MTTSYRCDTCGREFDAPAAYQLHEARCGQEPDEGPLGLVGSVTSSDRLALVRLFNNWTPGEQP